MKFLIDEVATNPKGFIIEKILEVFRDSDTTIRGISVSLLRKKDAKSRDVYLTEMIYEKLEDAKGLLIAYTKKAEIAAKRLAKKEGNGKRTGKEDHTKRKQKHQRYLLPVIPL